MSARDSAGPAGPGSGGAGGLANGGIGGGFGGGAAGGRGGMGAGGGVNGGYGSQTGLTTGNRMYGGIAVGRPGGAAMNPGAWGVRPQPSIAQAPMNRPAVPGLLGPAAPVPAVEQGLTVPASMPGFMNNPFVDKPATIADYVRGVVKSYQSLNAPPAPPSTPGLSYKYNFQMAPGQTPGNAWAGGGLYGINRPVERGPSTMTQSFPSTSGGYPSLGGQDTRPAGVW